MAGLVPRNTRIAAGFAHRADLAAGASSRVDCTSAGERSEEPVVCVNWGKQGAWAATVGGRSLGVRGGRQHEEGE